MIERAAGPGTGKTSAIGYEGDGSCFPIQPAVLFAARCLQWMDEKAPRIYVRFR